MSNTQIINAAFGRGTAPAERAWKNTEAEVAALVAKVVDLPVALRGTVQWVGSRDLFATTGGVVGSLTTVNGKGAPMACCALVGAVYFGAESRQNILNGVTDPTHRAAIAAAIDAVPQCRTDGKLLPLSRDMLLTGLRAYVGTGASLATIKAQVSPVIGVHVDRSDDAPKPKAKTATIYDLVGKIGTDADSGPAEAEANAKRDAAEAEADAARVELAAAQAQHAATLINNAIAVRGTVNQIAARFIADHGTDTASALVRALQALLKAEAKAAKAEAKAEEKAEEKAA